jgi:hypothetical protein
VPVTAQPPQLREKLPDPDNPGKFLKKPGAIVPYDAMEEALAKDAQPGYFLKKKLCPRSSNSERTAHYARGHERSDRRAAQMPSCADASI